MKILLLGKLDLYRAMGGDRVQIESTAEELRKLNVVVDVKTDLDFDPTAYDLLHVFQLDWTPETYLYAQKVKKAHKPLVLSPIHHNVDEVKRFDDDFAFDYRRLSKVLFKDQFNRDTFKNVYRSLFFPKKLYPTLVSIVKGFKKIQKQTLEMADAVLVQTNLEAADLERTYGVKLTCVKVPNGVSSSFLTGKFGSNKLSFENYILSVGRIEPRKNQLHLIDAVANLRTESGLDLKLVFIGGMNTRQHFEYSYVFNKKLKQHPWITYISKVPYEEMPTYYHFAKVGVSVSWFETTGLTSLEALFSGTNAVASGDRAQECLGNYASYCKPYDIDSIKEAVKKEFAAPRPIVADDFRKEYTWENAAAKTLQVYKTILREK
jgi:glycosyltransferase involved in cell wall biosynthesis